MIIAVANNLGDNDSQCGRRVEIEDRRFAVAIQGDVTVGHRLGEIEAERLHMTAEISCPSHHVAKQISGGATEFLSSSRTFICAMVACGIAIGADVATASGQSVGKAAWESDVLLIVIVLLVMIDFRRAIGLLCDDVMRGSLSLCRSTAIRKEDAPLRRARIGA